MPFSLRDYQVASADRIFASLAAGHRGPVCSMATGSGKSVVIAEAVRRQVEASNQRVIVLAHRQEIVGHLARTIASHTGWPVGIEMAAQRSHGEMVVVGSVGTLGRKDRARLRRLNPAEFGLGIVDECHHSILSNDQYAIPAQHFGRIDWRRQPRTEGAFWSGFSATTDRSDGVTLGGMFDHLAVDIPLDWCLANGHLVPPRAERIVSHTSLDGLRRRGEDFNDKELGERINNPERNQLIVRHYLDGGEDRQFLAFVPTIAHARQLAGMFQACGVAARSVDYRTPDAERAAAVAKYEAGDVRGLVNVGVFTEGTDLPMCSLIYLARPTFSRVLATQMVGRGLRPCPEIDKVDCRLVDIADVTSHELVTIASLLGHCNWPTHHGSGTPNAPIPELPLLDPVATVLTCEPWDPLDKSDNLDLAVDPARWYRTADGWSLIPTFYERYDLVDWGEDGWLVRATVEMFWMIAEHYLPEDFIERDDAIQLEWDARQEHRDAYEIRPTVWPRREDAVNYATKLIRRHHPIDPPEPDEESPYLPEGPITKEEKVAEIMRQRVPV